MDQLPVCILMPCLNARRFLEPRVASIQGQTFTGWQVLVLDSGSTDGSWEFFTEVAARDPRFLLHRVPREGLYAALNRGIEMARSDFLLIATCDDTMAACFLDKMLGALARVPEAGLAVCDLEFIDEHGQSITLAQSRIGACRLRTPVVGEELDNLNFRPCPHDSILHLAGETVYYSLTQMLVRKALAQRAPRFGTDRGSFADFGWSLRLTNLAGTVHVPEKLTAWRLHGDQLSARPDMASDAYIPAMCRSGLKAICSEHHALLSRNDCEVLAIPSRVMQAQADGQRTRLLLTWLEGILLVAWMCIERPAGTLRALLGVRLQSRHLKQTWIAFVLRRLGLSPRGID